MPKNYKKGDFNSHASWNLSRKLESNLRKPAFNKKKGHLKDKNDLQSDTNESVNFSAGLGLGSIVPPPPPPEIFRTLCEDDTETEAMSAMLISWYMSGYHTGYYQGLKMAKKQS